MVILNVLNYLKKKLALRLRNASIRYSRVKIVKKTLFHHNQLVSSARVGSMRIAPFPRSWGRARKQAINRILQNLENFACSQTSKKINTVKTHI